MTNVAKYFVLLEALKFSEENKPSAARNANAAEQTEDLLQHNVQLLKKFTKKDTNELLQHLAEELQLQLEPEVQLNNVQPLQLDYIVQLQYVLLEIVQQVNFDSDAKSDLISMQHMNLCIAAVQHLSIFALYEQLHTIFYQKGSVFMSEKLNKCQPNAALLQVSVAFFARILKIKQFHTANSLEFVLRDYMAAIYTLFLLAAKEQLSAQQQAYLEDVWLHVSKVQYFRNTMLLKGIKNLPINLKNILHQQLLQKLAANEGFASFVSTMQTATVQQAADEQIIEMIAQIVTHSGHAQKFQQNMIKQLFQYIDSCLLQLASNTITIGLRAATMCLRRYYNLNAANQQQIGSMLEARLRILFEPEDLISGLLLMQHAEFCMLVCWLFQIFCSSSMECLPSALLVNYLPLMLQLHFHIPAAFDIRKKIANLIIRCLDNCADLNSCIQNLYLQKYPSNWRQLHARVRIVINEEHDELSLKIVSSSAAESENIMSLALPEVLMTQQHNILSYRIFMLLLQQLAEILQQDVDEPKPNIALLQTEQEIVEFINQHYSLKMDLLYMLNLLISHSPLRAQFNEHATEFLQFLQDFTKRRLLLPQQQEEMDQILLMLLLVCQELLQRAQLLPDKLQGFASQLQQLRQLSANRLLQQRIDGLLPMLRGEFDYAHAQANNAFNMARELIESRESHLQVYGIQMLLDLLRQKDNVAKLNGHLIIALALSTLHDPESYTFLNCVRLFVALVNVMEAEVLEVLCDEYINEQSNIDYRLVVGEALIKVARELGPLTYKYKNVLFNCFLNGTRSTLDEFRMTSFTNLAQLCRILCYQVHRFFYELINIIDCELTSGTYVPAKRAAVLVLSELLEGMDNLLDFQEMLLPVYRCLKLIEADEKADKKMRIHAANGLKTLNEKCLNMICQEQKLQKEIKILGVKDTLSTKKQYDKHPLKFI